MTQTMAPMVPDATQMVRAITVVRASGVQIININPFAWMNAMWIGTSSPWFWVESIPPGGTSSVVSPPVADYNVIVFRVPPGDIAYQQQYRNDPTAPVSVVPIS